MVTVLVSRVGKSIEGISWQPVPIMVNFRWVSNTLWYLPPLPPLQHRLLLRKLMTMGRVVFLLVLVGAQTLSRRVVLLLRIQVTLPNWSILLGSNREVRRVVLLVATVPMPVVNRLCVLRSTTAAFPNCH